jgi:tripartite-type tricarboxylate transporter receptor subunit TctC
MKSSDAAHTYSNAPCCARFLARRYFAQWPADCSLVAAPQFFSWGTKPNSFEATGCALALWRVTQPPLRVGARSAMVGWPTTRKYGELHLKIRRWAAAAAALACLVGGFISPGMAESWPTRTVTIVTPFAAGSVTDATARLIGQALQEALGQPFVIENKTGAGGMIAALSVARADPDGYTLLLTTNSTHSAAPALYKKVPYDPIKDFVPVARIGSFPSVVVVNPDLKVNSIQELVAYAKANPGKLSYGHGNSSGYIAGEAIKHQTGVDIVRVSYRSNPAAVTDLIAGHIPMMIPDLNNALPQIAEKKMRPLAVLTKQRSSDLPDVPTLAESVMPGFDLLAWAGLFGPSKMPPEVVEILAREIKAALAKAEILQRLKSSGVEPYWGDTEEFKGFVASELVKWTDVIKAAGIEPE